VSIKTDITTRGACSPSDDQQQHSIPASVSDTRLIKVAAHPHYSVPAASERSSCLKAVDV